MIGLAGVLSLRKRELVCLVGAGGKTSLLQRLVVARPFSSSCLVTTSTKMFRWELESCGPLVLENDYETLIRTIRARGAPVTAAASTMTSEGKAIGYDVSTLERLYGSHLFRLIVVEADGARGKDLKAPGPAEPVVPASTTNVLALVGIKAFGRPIGTTWVHRPALLASLADQKIGTMITEETFRRVLERYRELSLDMAPHAAFVAVINQADSSQWLKKARRVARELNSVRVSVVITDSHSDDCVRAVYDDA